MKNGNKHIIRNTIITGLIGMSYFGINNAILKANHIKDAEHKTPSALIQDDKKIGVDGMATRNMLREVEKTRKDDRLAETPVRTSDQKGILLAQLEPKKIENTPQDNPPVSVRINRTILRSAYPIIGEDYLEIEMGDDLVQRKFDITHELRKIGLDRIPVGTETILAEGSIVPGSNERGKKVYIVIPAGLLLVIDSYWSPKENDGVLQIASIKLDYKVDGNLPHTFFKSSSGEDFIIFVHKDELGIEKLENGKIEVIDIQEKVGPNGVPAGDIQFKQKDPTHVEVYIKGKLSFTVDMTIYDYVSN